MTKRPDRPSKADLVEVQLTAEGMARRRPLEESRSKARCRGRTHICQRCYDTTLCVPVYESSSELSAQSSADSAESLAEDRYPAASVHP